LSVWLVTATGDLPSIEYPHTNRPVSNRKHLFEWILYGRAGCGLCDRLEGLIQPHLGAMPTGVSVTLAKRNIDDDVQWQRLYNRRIPVLACGDQIILEGRPSPDQVARAIAQWVRPWARSSPDSAGLYTP